MPIYLIRHGQSEFNAAHAPGLPDPMIFDAPLTAKGVQQARAARAEVARLGIRQVIASPLTRAVQTALHIFGDSVPITVMTGPHERLEHSCDVGRPPAALARDFPQLAFDHIPENWWHQGPPNDLGYCVEDWDVFGVRIRAFVAMLENMSDRPLAIVGHGNTFLEMTGHNMANCEIRAFSPGS
jgi:broad specificity phosphatase PhoE